MKHAYSLPIRRLGRSDLQVTGISLGGAGIGGGYGEVPEEEAVETVRRAVEWGINYIDTSPLYGESERRIGLALKGRLRRHVILSTKTGTHPERRGDYSWDATMWSVENSLKLLRTDYLELVYVHDPDDLEPVFARRGALEALESLKEQEVIGSIGLGQRRHDFHTRAIESGRFDVILTYNDYHPLRTTAVDTLLPLARNEDVGVVNGSPLAHGFLIGQDPDQLPEEVRRRASERDLDAARRLYRWCVERDVPMVAVALQFCLREGLIDCTLTGAKTAAELEENLKYATMPIPEELWQELEALHLREAVADR